MTAEKHKIRHTYKQKELLMKCQQFFFACAYFLDLTFSAVVQLFFGQDAGQKLPHHFHAVVQ